MNARPSAKEIIEKLGLESHPEQISFREIYRSSTLVTSSAIGKSFEGSRSLSTSIIFLIEAERPSLLHRVRSDEIWHFHAGDPVDLFVEKDGAFRSVRLGPDLLAGDQPQCVVPAHATQGAMVVPGGSWSLLGATVSPGFEFSDFELVGANYARALEGLTEDQLRRLTKSKAE